MSRNLFNNLCLIKNFSLFYLFYAKQRNYGDESSNIIDFQSLQFQLVSCNDERLIVGEAGWDLLVVLILKCIADASRTGFRVVMWIREATKRVLQSSMTLYEEHYCATERGDNKKRHYEQQASVRWAWSDWRECIGLDFKNLCVADVWVKTL